MHINERDQVNYHGFLRALREMHGVSQEYVAKGVCTVSGMNRFENGNRNAEKLMRDRLTSRLGISSEKYEDYLQPKEYVRWEQRLRIVNAIEKRELQKAKEELESYETLENLNRLNRQFIEAMRFNIMLLEGAPEEELFDCIKNAVKCTVQNVKRALAGAHLLAEQEINLIAEQMRLCPPTKVVSDEKEWRITEYQKLITYIEKSQWEKLLKAKVYPKVAYYIGQILVEKESTEVELRQGLKLCHNAIELLRDCSRLYYFIELTETRRALATRLLCCDISSTEKAELEEMLRENNEWENVFKGLYTEYEVPVYMSDFCYLYYENESHNMVEVIETRRNMLGISRVRLSEGICSDRSIVRFEREGNNPCIEMVRCLFERLGMCAEYRRTRVLTYDANVLMLFDEVARNINDYAFEKGRENLKKLEDRLSMEIVHNKQQVKRIDNLIKLYLKEISKDDFYNLSKEAFEYTISDVDCLLKANRYLTRNEITFVFDFAFKLSGDLSENSVKIIEELCEDVSKNNAINPYLLPTYELLTGELVSNLGNRGEYDKSNMISLKMMKECLFYRRTGVLSDFIYNNLWNNQKSVKELLENPQESLRKCLYISNFIRRDDRITFFRNLLFN